MSRKCPKCGTSFPDEVFFCGNDGTITIQEQPEGDHDDRLGRQLGGYLVVARVADGAMGRVYEGRHPETKARVAIKVLHASVARDQVAVERFKREYETAGELDGPHIVKVLEFGETPDHSWFMTMEYLEGEELGELVARDGAMPVERAVRILCQTALALEHAHAFGVIHRDLKPGNIFLCRSEKGDDVRLLDFGSVKLQMETGPKLTAFGTTLGSPYYMSPEQAMGKQDVDGRTDVFALAGILYEMLTGKIAFEGDTVAEILMKIVNESPPPASSKNPSVSPALDDVIDRGLQKEKADRYGTASELATASCSALCLSGELSELAQMSVEELAKALAEATPPPAAPLGGEPPLPDLPRMPAEVTEPIELEPMPIPMRGGKSNAALLFIVLGLGFIGLLLVGGLAALLLL